MVKVEEDLDYHALRARGIGMATENKVSQEAKIAFS